MIETLRSTEAPPRYRSPFGGLWVDWEDAPQVVARGEAEGAFTPEQAEQLRFWMERGYVILRNAVPHSVIDGMNAEIDHAWSRPDTRLMLDVAWKGILPLEPALRQESNKLLDFYVYSENARQVIFAEPIAAFLRLIFGRDILAFQGLSFERGSEQRLHQDPTYVVVDSPMELVASWIALEDIRPGCGELEYYVGSHQLEAYVFDGQYKHYHPGRDGVQAHLDYLDNLVERCGQRGLALERFAASKGDVLIWHADLAHGGSPIADASLSRRSMVAHYCPNNVNPYYFSYSPERGAKRQYNQTCYFSSFYYPLDGDPPA